MAINILDEKKIEDEIKDLDSIEAMYYRDLKEYETKNLEKKKSDKAFEKYKKKCNKCIEKIKILKLEKKIRKRDLKLCPVDLINKIFRLV